MKSHLSSKKNKRNDLVQYRSRLLWISISVVALLLLGGLGLSFNPLRTYGKQLEAANSNLDGSLAYLQSGTHGRSEVVHR
jgi:hypothetical protein